MLMYPNPNNRLLKCKGGGKGGGKQQNYKRNFVEQIQLDKVDSFTLQHKSKLLQIQIHLVFQPIKTGVCGNLITCSNTKWGFSEISIFKFLGIMASPLVGCFTGRVSFGIESFCW